MGKHIGCSCDRLREAEKAVARKTCLPVYDTRHPLPLCSLCNDYLLAPVGLPNYCQNCGAEVVK